MKKKYLRKAIAASLLGGLLLGTNYAFAATITGGTGEKAVTADTTDSTGAKTIAAASTANVKNVKPSYSKYTYADDKTLDGIMLDATRAWLVNAKNKTLTVNGVAFDENSKVAAIGVLNGGDFNFTSATTTTSTISLNATGTGTQSTYGFYLQGTDIDNQSLGYMPITAVSITDVHSEAEAYGLYADNSYFVGSYGTSVKDFAIGKKTGDAISYGVSTTAGGADKAAGIYATNSSQVLIPKITAYVNANGAVATGDSKISLGSDKASSNVLIYVDKDNVNDYVALRAQGGQIDVDLKDAWAKGTVSWGQALSNKQVNINGNIVTLKDAETPTKDSVVNLSLTNANSTWEGVAYTDFVGNEEKKGEINLWLQNGATWTNALWGSQTGFSGSHVTNVYGDAGTSFGNIFQNDTNSLTIDNMSGAIKVFMAHTATTAYAVGDVIVKNAASGSAVTMVTNNDGIDTSDDTATANALNALANKLYYMAAGSNENLTGYVQIAEGLTSSSAMLKEGFISFDTTTGQGSYEAMGYKDVQSKTSFDAPIYGTVDEDKKYIRGGVLREDGKYHLDEDTTISLTGGGTEYNGISNREALTVEGTGKVLNLNIDSEAAETYGIRQDGTDKNITINAKELNIDVEGTKRVEGIRLNGTAVLYEEIKSTNADATKMTINGDVKLRIKAGATAAMGVHTMGYSFLDVNGDLTIKGNGTDDDKWGVNAYGTNNGILGNAYFGDAAVYVHGTQGADYKAGGVNVTGDTDIVAQGGGLYINMGEGVINLGGNVNIEMDPTVYKGTNFGDAVFYAARAELGHIYINVNKDTEGAVIGNVTGAGTNKVNILGNIGATRGADNSGIAPSNYESFVNVGLTTADSSWKGVAHNAYSNEETGTSPFRGEINLWLQNGATWTNEKYGETGNVYAGWKYDDYGSRLTKLVGGDSAVNKGYIFQNETTPITIDNYSGNTKVFYAHDAAAPTTVKGGDITIKKAAASSAITLTTDNSGITMTDDAAVNSVLNALANKLWYTAYASGEKNLSGTVEIAEGLTSSSASLKTGTITFAEATGQGSYVDPYKEQQEVFTFTTPILGNAETDVEYIDGGVLRKDGTYVFDRDTTIISSGTAVEKGLYGSAGTAIIDASSTNQHTVLNLQGHNLTVKGATAAGLIDIMATGVKNSTTGNIDIGTVEINNPGKIVLEAERTGTSGYPTPLYVNGGGKIVIHNGEGDLDSKVVTINSINPGNAQFCGIKTMNGINGARSQIIIDGLIDIESSAYNANPGTNIEGISNVASTVSIGGGKIKLYNDDGNGQKGNGLWAIRSYGEFTSSNPGYVYFNAVHDGVEGAATGSGKNKAVIEGGIGMSGTMNVVGSINVGFGTADSYFKGDVRSTGSYGAAQGNGAVNLWFTPGSYWEGDNISAGHDTNVYLDGANWTGKSTQASGTTKGGDPIGYNLDMKNGSLWKNTGGSSLLSLSGSGSYIDMTGENAGAITIDNYSGNTKVFYAHDAAAPTTVKGGDITIKKPLKAVRLPWQLIIRVSM